MFNVRWYYRPHIMEGTVANFHFILIKYGALAKNVFEVI